ncbi:MAG: alpha/beta hydrolase [Planctomycetes bacterium]|nr:alpha/beta hydrolase [Planctomycetota bacterium]
MKKWSFGLVVSLLPLFIACTSSPAPSGNEVISLWPHGNPDSWVAAKPEEAILGDDGVLRIWNVGTASLTYYPPASGEIAHPTAMIVCPGGGYRILAWNKEGTEIASFLADHGYHAFVLKYRLPNPGDVRYAVALQDAQRAIRLIREREVELGIEKIGIMGFSAGGHLAATVAGAKAASVDAPIPSGDPAPTSSRPDFVGLIYPAYLMADTQTGELAAEVIPSKNPPPTFMAHALDDRIPSRNSIRYAETLTELGIPAEAHLYSRGGHGFGMTLTNKLPVGDWPQHLLTWLGRQNGD